MIGSILVPLDGSHYGEHALPYAFSIARRADLPVHLVHVHDAMISVASPACACVGQPSAPEQPEAGFDYLQGLRERIHFDQDLEIETALIEGDVVDALAQYARDVKASLIVMTTGGRGALERFILGSVTDQLIRMAIPPVLLVHPDRDDTEQDVDVHLRHLLLPLETDADAEGVVRPALELCGLFDGECTILHVQDDTLADEFAPRIAESKSCYSMRGAATSACASRFEHLAECLREEGTKVVVRTVENPYPAAVVF
jgi:nucleotide-binding universal stress UspA family protein